MPHPPATSGSLAWHKASRSTTAPDMGGVEIRAASTTVTIRDSRRPAEALTAGHEEWSALLAAIRQGRL